MYHTYRHFEQLEHRYMPTLNGLSGASGHPTEWQAPKRRSTADSSIRHDVIAI